jgi:hypothetical protein
LPEAEKEGLKFSDSMLVLEFSRGISLLLIGLLYNISFLFRFQRSNGDIINHQAGSQSLFEGAHELENGE